MGGSPWDPGLNYTVFDPDAALGHLGLTPELADFLSIWASLRRGRTVPVRPADVPSTFRTHLGWVGLIDRSGADFRFRLVGSHVVELAGRDGTGKPIGALYAPREAEAIRRECREVLDNEHCIYSAFRVRAPGRDFITLTGLALPLSTDGRQPDLIIARYQPRA